MTKLNLIRLGRHAKPDHAFDVALQKKLISAGYLPMKRAGWLTRWQTAGVSFGLVASLASGTGVYAYSSDNVLPNHPLYPMKTAIEQVELALPQSLAHRQDVRLKFLQRRLKESMKMRAKRLPIPKNHEQAMLANLASIAAEKTDADNAVKDAASEKTEEARALVNADHQELTELMDEREDAADEDGRLIDEELSKQMERVNEDLGRLHREQEQERER